jgi:hypothetical protein
MAPVGGDGCVDRDANCDRAEGGQVVHFRGTDVQRTRLFFLVHVVPLHVGVFQDQAEDLKS